MKTVIIVNPVSGRGKALKLLPKVIEYCEAENIEFKISTTASSGDATRLARLARLDRFDRVIVLGGDGTINEAGQALAGSDIILGVLPAGSGNDLFKLLTKSGKLDEALDVAFRGNGHNIDIGLVNGRMFFNAVGIGFDAEVAAEATKSAISGVFIYLAAVFKVWRKFIPYQVDIELDQVKFSQNATLICVGNGRNTGGVFRLTPQASLDDGLFDTCIIQGVPKFKIFSYLPRAIKGTHVRLEGVRIYRSRKVLVKSATPLPVHIDGEVVGEATEKLEITLEPRKLKVAMAEGLS
jgi:YegS/Rv2252/BmrU family lipid kinase